MNKIVLVTGASAGFGAAITRRLAADGYRVIAAARRLERLEELRAELGKEVLPFQLDVADKAAVMTLPASLPPGWQEIDILVNNAGLALGLEPAWLADPEDWEQMVEVNVKGLMRMTRAILPGMIDRNFGDIINLSSMAGDYAYPGGNVYGATKAFVTQFSLNLRADLVSRGVTGVRVMNLEPGLCGGTEFSAVRFGGDESKAASVYKGTQPILAEDVAMMVSQFLSWPRHINPNRLEVMPTCQASGPLQVYRKPG